MSNLEGIRVAVTGERRTPSQTVGNVVAIVNEIEAMLDDLLAGGPGASIDLRSLPMSPHDYEILRQVLGDGEVSAVVQALGPTHVRETAVSGVWWVSHCNGDDQIVAEFIEIAQAPAILMTHPDDLCDAKNTLRAQLSRVVQTE